MDFSLGPIRNGVAISVGGGDQTPTLGQARGIYVGGGGNMVCRLLGANADITFTGLLAGNYYPIQVAIIRQTGTTITNSLVMY